MMTDIDQLWLEQQDDVFDVVADIDPPSSRIEYAFKAGSIAAAAQWEEFDYERDNPKRLVEHVLALMVERDKAQALAASISEEMHRLAKEVERTLSHAPLRPRQREREREREALEIIRAALKGAMSGGLA